MKLKQNSKSQSQPSTSINQINTTLKDFANQCLMRDIQMIDPKLIQNLLEKSKAIFDEQTFSKSSDIENHQPDDFFEY
jgi:uncharacterized membrane protein